MYWAVAVLTFTTLFVLCFTPLFTDVQSTPRLATLLTYLGILVAIHSTTLDYASQRPGA